MDMREHRLIYPSKTIDELSSSKGKYGAQSASVEYDTASPRCVKLPMCGLSDKTGTCGLYRPEVARYQLRHTQITYFWTNCITF